ncbi:MULTISPECIES: SDR family oxidoreductase [Mesorhizobium]|uniref:SDR family NAD(P)-dependent oxidoreductase n=1 Tax=Mesorhizobium TaxID=68287 RepID=UPI0003CE0A2B|nr:MULTISPECIES: SDR family oxidoreductase [Mesorhizobium]ESY68922.1 short-chain dehydrogenase [Mesorhizobium sp. LNHC232B00]WJI40612.1 SDR family oxidoreductase [Mesorhizobium opportunistum]
MTKMSKPRVAVITGAAGGIGQAFAERLAKDGADIVAVDLKVGDETRRLVEAQGQRALALTGDVTDPVQVEMIRLKALAEFGKVDILINNAGIYPIKDFSDISWEDWRTLLALNLDAPFLMSKAFVPTMVANGWGRIVNLASNTFGLSVSGLSHYIASKGGIIGFTRGLASDLGIHGITVNALAPGLTRTPGVLARGVGSNGRSQDEEFQQLAQAQAIRRTLVPRDLVGMLSYLASEESDVFTGQTVYVDGGLVRG